MCRDVFANITTSRRNGLSKLSTQCVRCVSTGSVNSGSILVRSGRCRPLVGRGQVCSFSATGMMGPNDGRLIGVRISARLRSAPRIVRDIHVAVILISNI